MCAEDSGFRWESGKVFFTLKNLYTTATHTFSAVTVVAPGNLRRETWPTWQGWQGKDGRCHVDNVRIEWTNPEMSSLWTFYSWDNASRLLNFLLGLPWLACLWELIQKAILGHLPGPPWTWKFEWDHLMLPVMLPWKWDTSRVFLFLGSPAWGLPAAPSCIHLPLPSSLVQIPAPSHLPTRNVLVWDILGVLVAFLQDLQVEGRDPCVSGALPVLLGLP